MPPPAEGFVRVYANANVGSLRAGRWQDVPASPEIHRWASMRLVTLDDPPADLPPQPCCGQV